MRKNLHRIISREFKGLHYRLTQEFTYFFNYHKQSLAIYIGNAESFTITKIYPLERKRARSYNRIGFESTQDTHTAGCLLNLHVDGPQTDSRARGGGRARIRITSPKME